MPRIIYFAPDIKTPSGGVNTIYEHVATLAGHGLEAWVAHFAPDYAYAWAPCRAPVLHVGQGLTLNPGDRVVTPENNGPLLRRLRDVPGLARYLFCQNHFYAFQGLSPGESWRDFSLRAVICCSEAVREFAALLDPGLRAVVVPCSVNAAVFEPAEPKRLQVAYMPRKQAELATFIRGVFPRLHPDLADVPWVAIDGMDRTDAARILGESSVFLSLSHYEGLGLPPLEAMAAGCLVIGFHGFGGREYALPDNGLWCAEGDVMECAARLGDALRLWREGGQGLESMLAEARRTALVYSPERARQALLDFWRAELSR